MKVHFLRTVDGGRITYESKVVHRTRRMATAQAKIRDVDDNFVAMGTRAFRVF